MKIQTYKVKYIHGHFIETVSNKRIIPIHGAEYIITAGEEDFIKEDPKLLIGYPLSETAKEKWVIGKYGKDNVVKILHSGEKLFFRVGNSKVLRGDESHQFIFLCTLKEDLYLFLTSGGKKENSQDWRLVDCNCELEKCLAGGLALNEKISAESINKLFSQTVMFFFNMQRSGSTNVYDTFFHYQPDIEITFSGMLSKRYFSLGKIRNRIAKDFMNKMKT